MPYYEKLLIVSLLVFCLNIPFGYWRANVRKFSWQWILAIHIPVPFVILLRIAVHTGWQWISFVLFVFAFFMGQLLGGYLHKSMIHKKPECISSCLFVDLYRCFRV